MFNCYRHWLHILLRQPGDAPVIILIREVFTQEDPLSVVLYGFNLVPLIEYLRDADPTLLSPFYTNDAAFCGSVKRSAAQLKLLMALGTDRGYFPDPDRLLFIADNPEKEEATIQEFEQAGIKLNYIGGN